MRFLNVADYSVMAVYCGILVVMAFYLHRKATANLEAYFLAGRKLPWWALGISGMTAFLDMTGTMVIVSFLFMLGPRGLFVEFRGGAVLVLAFMMLWTGKWHRRSNCMTGAEWYIYRFGRGKAAQTARVLTAAGGVLLNISLLAYLIQGAGTFLSMFIPLPPKICALTMVGLTTLYTLMSGFFGVVYTDLFQSGIILVTVVVVVVLAVGAVTGFDGNLADLAYEVTGSSGWTSSVPSLHTPMPDGYQRYQGLFFVALIYLVRNVIGGIGTGADPRYFGARNERECGQLTFFWTWLMTFRWPMMMGFAVLGLFLVRDLFPNQSMVPEAAVMVKSHLGEIPKNAWEDTVSKVIRVPEQYPELMANLQQLLGDRWVERLLMVSYEGTINPERILPGVILMDIPAGWRGLFIISLVAAAMSTFAPTVNMTVALFTRDIYQAYIHPNASNRALMWASYGFGAVLVAAGFLMAYSAENINAIWGWIIMSLGTGLAVPGLLRLYWWRFNAGGVIVGTFVGIVGALSTWLWTRIGYEMTEHVQFFVLLSIGLVGCVVGTYLTKPTHPKLIERFYKTTRPFGFWGPLKRTLDPDVRQKMEREHFFDIAAVPSALMWQICLFLLPMQAIIGAWRAFGVTFVLFAASLVGLYFLWWRNLPPASEVPGRPFDPTADEFEDEVVVTEPVPAPLPAAISTERA